jgi:hypothetical protein
VVFSLESSNSMSPTSFGRIVRTDCIVHLYRVDLALSAPSHMAIVPLETQL